MKISIIIPIGEKSDYLEETVHYILEQTHKDFEIIILPNNKIKDFKNKKIKVIETGKINPADKRDIGSGIAKGEVLAFIDDDAYPDKDWLKNALKNFENKEIVAVGGPGLTPKKDSFMQQIGGKILESKLASGTEDYRCKIKKRKFVEDYPSFNFFVRKNTFDKIRGFDYRYWRGEDTALCLKLIKYGKIIYDPNVVVYHHKRALFLKHLRQIWKCALYRGFFAKKFPKTSRKFAYFVPSLFLFGLLFGFIVSFYNLYLMIIYIDVLIIYFTLLIIESIKINDFKGAVILIPGIFLTHIVYGFAFLIGLIVGDIK